MSIGSGWRWITNGVSAGVHSEEDNCLRRRERDNAAGGVHIFAIWLLLCHHAVSAFPQMKGFEGPPKEGSRQTQSLQPEHVNSCYSSIQHQVKSRDLVCEFIILVFVIDLFRYHLSSPN